MTGYFILILDLGTKPRSGKYAEPIGQNLIYSHLLVARLLYERVCPSVSQALTFFVCLIMIIKLFLRNKMLFQ